MEMMKENMKANQKFRNLKADEDAVIQYILTGIVILVMSVLAIAIVYPVIAGVNVQTIDTNLRTAMGESSDFKPAANATASVLSGANIVMGINPLAALVAVAAGILLLLMGVFTPGGGRAGL
jgi:hypothetical protein